MFTKLAAIKKNHEALERALADDSLMKDQKQYQSKAKEYADLGPLIKLYDKYMALEQELVDIKQLMTAESHDSGMHEFYEEEKNKALIAYDTIREQLEEMLLDDENPYKDRNIFIEVRAGTGGEEAALFASDLFRMYSRYAQILGLKMEVMSMHQTGLKGFKEIIFSLSGNNCYKKFKYESGTHRVQRVPVTETSGRIHTSAVTVAVLPEADEVEVNINPEELRIDVYRSSGPGGQSVNKTESAVRITHIPTNTVVTCQDEKSQHKNKAKAMRILRTRIYDQVKEDHDQQISADRKSQVGSGDRSGRIRTYNFAERRVTDHRIGLTLHSLDKILEGEMGELIDALAKHERQKQLSS